MPKTITLSKARYWYIVAAMFLGGIAFADAWRGRAHLGWHTVWIVGIVGSIALALGWLRYRKETK